MMVQWGQLSRTVLKGSNLMKKRKEKKHLRTGIVM